MLDFRQLLTVFKMVLIITQLHGDLRNGLPLNGFIRQRPSTLTALLEGRIDQRHQAPAEWGIDRWELRNVLCVGAMLPRWF